MKPSARWVGAALAGIGLVAASAAGPRLPGTRPAAPDPVELPPVQIDLGNPAVPPTPSADPAEEVFVPPTAAVPDEPVVLIDPTVIAPPPKLAGPDGRVKVLSITAGDEIEPAAGADTPADPPTGRSPRLFPVSTPALTMAPMPTATTPVVVENGFTLPSVPATAGGEHFVVYAEGDYLLWRYRGQNLPPLVTAGDPLDPVPGALGQVGTAVLFGGPTGSELASGFRGRFGTLLTGTPIGIEAGGFYTQPQETSAYFNSGQFPVLARPYFDILPNNEATFLLGFPDAFTGDIAIGLRTNLSGFEANATKVVGYGFTAFAGFKYARLTDDLVIIDRTSLGNLGLAFVNGVGLLPDSTIQLTERVLTRSTFSGGQIGLRHRYACGKFGYDVRGSLAVGTTAQRVEISGRTDALDAAGLTFNAPAALLAQPSNSGAFSKDRVALLPEVGVKVFYNVLPGVSLQAGYDLMYWTNVVRAGDQIDRAVDTRQTPSSLFFTPGLTGARPVPIVEDTSFWAYGFNLGLRLEY